MFGGEQVNVTYNADVSGYTKSMGEAVAATERYTTAIDGVQGVIPKMTMAVAKAFGGDIRNELMKPAVQEAAAYEQALSGVETRAKAAGSGVGVLSASVKTMARDMPIGLSGAITQFETLAKSGLAANKDIERMATSTAQLGAATGEMGAGLTSSFTQFQRAFGQMSGGEFEAMADSLTNVTTKMGASASATMDFANTVAPLAQNIGMTATEVTGFSAAFATAGQDGYRAANVFGGMLQDVQRAVRDGGPGLDGYAEALGMTTEKFREFAKENPTEAITKFFEATSKGGPEAQRILEDIGLGSVREQRTIQAVARSGGLRQALAESQAGWGEKSSSELSKEAFSGLNDSLERMQETFRQVAEASGRPYLNYATPAVNAMTSVGGVAAGVAGNETLQNVLTGVLGLRMAGSVAGKIGGMGLLGLGAASVPGVVTGAKKVGGFASQYKMPLLGAGIGAMAAGGVMDNPMLGLLGMGGLALASAPGTMKPFQIAAGKAMDFAYTSSVRGGTDKLFGSDRLSSFSGEKSVARSTGRVSTLGQTLGGLGAVMTADALTQGVAGFDKNDPGGAARARRQAETLTKNYQKALKEKTAGLTDQAKIDKVTKRLDKKYAARAAEAMASSAQPARAAAGGAIRQTGRFAALAGGGLLKAGAGALMSPIGMGVAAVGAVGALGYFQKQNRDKVDEIINDPTKNTARVFAEKSGQALKPIDKFSDGLSAAVENVETFADALNVSSKEYAQMTTSMEAYRKVELPANNMDVEKLREWVLSTSGAQGKGSMGAAISNIAAYRGQEIANEVGEAVGETEFSTAEDAARFAGQSAGGNTLRGDDTIVEDQGWFVRLGARISSDWTTSYLGKDEAIEEQKGFATQALTRVGETRDLYGNAAASEEAAKSISTYVTEALNAGMDEEGGFDFDKMQAFLTEFKNQGEITQETMDYIMSQAHQVDSGNPDATWQFGGNVRRLLTSGYWGRDSGNQPGEESASEVEKENQNRLNELERAKLSEDNTVERLKGSDLKYERLVGRAFEFQQENSLTPDELVELLKEGVIDNEGTKVEAPNWMMRNPALQSDLFGLTSLSNPAQFLSSSTVALDAPAPFGYGGDGMQMAQDQLKLLTPGADGESYNNSSPEGKMALAKYQTAQRAIPVQQAQAGQGGALLMGLANAADAREQVMSPDFSSLHENVQESIKQTAAQYEQYQIGIIQLAKQRAMTWHQYEVMVQRSTRDFYRQQAWAQEDFEIQSGRQEQEYYESRRWQISDFNETMKWQDEDFQRSRLRSEEKFYRERQYMAEDFAANATNPWEFQYSTTGNTFDSMAFNMEVQIENIEKQQKKLKKLRKMGMDPEAIDMFGLADPSKAADMALMSLPNQDVVDRYNRLAKRGVAAGVEDTENNNKSARRQKDEWGIQREHELEDYDRNVERTRKKFFRNIDRMDKRFKRSMRNMTEDFLRMSRRNTEQFSTSMSDAREDVELATTDIMTKWDDALQYVTGELGPAGEKWQSKTVNAMGKIQTATSDGWTDTTGTHKSAINWVVTAYQKLAELGVVPDKWSPETAPKRQRRSGNSSTTEPSGNMTTRSVEESSFPASDENKLTQPGGSSNFVMNRSTRARKSGGGGGGDDSGIKSIGADMPDWAPDWKDNDYTSGKIKPTLEKAQTGFTRFIDTVWNWATKSTIANKKSDSQTLFTDPGLKPEARDLAKIIFDKFPAVGEIGGKREDRHPDHPSGWALDVMTTRGAYNDAVEGIDKDSKSQQLGNIIQKWVINNWDEIGMRYGIWKNRIFREDYIGPPMPRGGVTEGHWDHLHLRMEPGADRNLAGVKGAKTKRKPFFKSGKRARENPYKPGEPLWYYIDPYAPDMDGDDDGYGDFTGNKVRGRKWWKKNGPDKYYGELATGGVALKEGLATVGEAGREAIIPLNGQGVAVIADAIAKYSRTYESRLARTSPYSRPVSTVTYHSEDHSTRFTGDITVKADDPNVLARELRQRAKRDRITSRWKGR